MKIDRSAFFFLTGAIAAGCVINPPPATPGGTTATTTPTAAPATPTADDAGAAPAPFVVGTGLFSAFHQTAGAPADADAGLPPPPPPAANCLDTGDAQPGACNAFHPDASCKAAPDFAGSKCGAYKAYFTPKVAAAAIACQAALSATSLCDGTQSDKCALTALKRSCPTTGTDYVSGCQAAAQVPACGVTLGDCLSYAGGLTQAGEDAIGHCMDEGGALPCAMHSFSDCLAALTAPAGGGTTPPSATGGAAPLTSESHIRSR